MPILKIPGTKHSLKRGRLGQRCGQQSLDIESLDIGKDEPSLPEPGPDKFGSGGPSLEVERLRRRCVPPMWANEAYSMTNEVIPHFHNDLGVPVIEIGAKKFMCMGALPPQDHPHVFCDMGDDVEYVCPYCSTFYRHNSALASDQARPAECEFHDLR